ncbi:MAG: Hsp20/alpha crystallin family protein [Candidatus Kariarchaeaceae archaeon]
MTNTIQANELHIINGKIVDESYDRDFHIFTEGRIITLYIILPGIIKESVNIKISGELFIIKTDVHKKYRKIYRKRQISLSGRLGFLVEPNTFSVIYELGILEINLALVN